MLLVQWLLMSIIMGACGTATDDQPTLQEIVIVGDTSQPIELQLIAQDYFGNNQLLADGVTIPLVGASSQGGTGTLLAIGVRANNIQVQPIQFTASIRDLNSQQIRLDQRTIRLSDVQANYAESGHIANFSNIPVCPNQWASQNLYDNEYELEVSITDVDGRIATQTLSVTPTCADGDDRCLCICAHGYVLGTDCSQQDNP